MYMCVYIRQPLLHCKKPFLSRFSDHGMWQ